ncbi:MAG: AAA family ATPase [Chloroflexi bacterium]|nr:AAA family ATPase [Chloroflexota bacterium]
MSTQRKLEQALAIIETQRGHLLEDDVVDVAIFALREQLAAQQASPAMQQHEQICVLVADMSGFTSVSEFLDAEEVRDMINAVWRKLDRVINLWGGKVDKHLGDGLIAWFGIPDVRDDDPQRAVSAALDMQTELQLFNKQQLQQTNDTNPFRTPHPLQMRIGIHIGTLYFGQLGSTDAQTAVGDTISIANHLQEAAPLGGILVSAEIHEHIYPYFNTTLLTTQIEETAYQIEAEVSQTFQSLRQEIALLETRFVGRSDELSQMQNGLQITIENNIAQIVTIVGETGIGKSRLLYEFDRLLALLPHRICLMQGSGSQDVNEQPYALIRSLLAYHYDIHPQNSAAIAREKLTQGILQDLPQNGVNAQPIVESSLQLLGYETTQFRESKPIALNLEYFSDKEDRASQIRGAGFRNLITLLTNILQQHEALILLLEDFHATDEGSYDFLDYLMRQCTHLPIFIVCATQPSLFQKRPSWHTLEVAERQEINLHTLSPIDSRHFLAEMLQKIEAMPLHLIDVIVNSAQGNPFDLHEMVDLFLQEQVIEDHGPRWQANMGRLLDIPSPPTVSNLWQGQFDRLPDNQQRILQRAAVFGPTFWDSALRHFSNDGATIDANTLETTLLTLESRQWIKPLTTSTIPNTHRYQFRHVHLQQLIYETIPAEQRVSYHSEAASWLTAQPILKTTRILRRIANHMVLAGDGENAAQNYGRAAQHAQANLALETAAFYYQKALNLIPDLETVAPVRIILYQGLANSLQKQARFEEAIAAYELMSETAVAIDDNQAQIQACKQQFLCYLLLNDLKNALDSIRPLTPIATQNNQPDLLTFTSAARGWVALMAGQTKMAGELARDAYSHSQSLEVSFSRAFSRTFLGNLARELGRYKQAETMTKAARTMFQELNEPTWECLMWNQLGAVAWEQWLLDTAVAYYELALQLAQNTADSFSMMMSLHCIGQINTYQAQFDNAEKHFQWTLTLAEKSQNYLYLALTANGLGKCHLAQSIGDTQTVQEIAQKEEHLQHAYRWFRRAIRLAQKAQAPFVRSEAMAGLAQLYLEDHLLPEAQGQAEEAVRISERALQQRPIRESKRATAVAWQALGLLLAKTLQKNKQTSIRGKTIDAIQCFARSHKLLVEAGPIGKFDLAHLLRVWALYEFRCDNLEQATRLAQMARSMLTELGLQFEADQMQEIVVSNK